MWRDEASSFRRPVGRPPQTPPVAENGRVVISERLSTSSLKDDTYGGGLDVPVSLVHLPAGQSRVARVRS